jgi:hypothetical protein
VRHLAPPQVVCDDRHMGKDAEDCQSEGTGTANCMQTAVAGQRARNCGRDAIASGTSAREMQTKPWAAANASAVIVSA